MSAHDRVRWDKVYREREDRPYPSPDPLLLDYTPPVPPDAERFALDFAGGLGQNGLWLAAQGYTVDILDISRVALSRARAEMAQRNLRTVNLIQADAEETQLEAERYDLVCVFRYLNRDLLPQLSASLKPGGRLIYETFNLQYLDIVPGFNVDYLIQGDELKDWLKGWQIIRHSHIGHITQLVARRPQT